MHLDASDRRRFYAKIDGPSSPDDDCHLWTASKDRDGYGRFHLNDAKEAAHRVAHFLATGEEPPAVLHRCDTPACCNPAHLEGGTQRENVADRDRKGRTAYGEGSGRAKLSADDVYSIRERRAEDRPPSYRALAREHGVDESTVRAAAKGRTWKRAGGPVEAS